MQGGIMIWLLTGGACALIAGAVGFRIFSKRQRRKTRRERSVKNRARQFGWDMVFGRRALRLTDFRSKADPE